MAKAKRLTKDKKQVLKVPKELISASEFVRRTKVWKNHYKKIPESKNYKRLTRQMSALRKGDMDTFRKLARGEEKSIVNGNSNPKPPFPDPYFEQLYGRLGIKENWENKIQEAKEKEMEIKAVS